jgi:hypothetical protein
VLKDEAQKEEVPMEALVQLKVLIYQNVEARVNQQDVQRNVKPLLESKNAHRSAKASYQLLTRWVDLSEMVALNSSKWYLAFRFFLN